MSKSSHSFKLILLLTTLSYNFIDTPIHFVFYLTLLNKIVFQIELKYMILYPLGVKLSLSTPIHLIINKSR